MAQFTTMAMIEASIKKATNGRLPVKMIVHKETGAFAAKSMMMEA